MSEPELASDGSVADRSRTLRVSWLVQPAHLTSGVRGFLMYCGLKASRRALADAEKAAELFRHGNVDFQLVWVLNVAFLGIIGGVLQKEIRIKILNQDIISTKVWNQHKTPIDNLASIRNKILHHYEQVYEGTDVYVPGVYEDGVYESKQIRREPFKGRDPAAVIGESIKLWEEILDTIEHRLRSRL